MKRWGLWNFASLAPMAFCMSIMLISCIGCDGSPATYTVSGSVSYQGKPVTGGLINFMPTAGQPLGGRINEDGTYSYRLPAGEFKVRIDTPPPMPEGWEEGDPLPKPKPRQVPEKFGQYRSSGLTTTVDAGSSSQTINFDLQ